MLTAHGSGGGQSVIKLATPTNSLLFKFQVCNSSFHHYVF